MVLRLEVDRVRQRDDNLAALHFDVKAVLILHPCVKTKRPRGQNSRGRDTPDLIP